jgi:hypothetical protein
VSRDDPADPTTDRDTGSTGSETATEADDPESRGSATGQARPDATESFAQVEQDRETVPDGALAHGRAVDTERVPATGVPGGFPFEITTADALCLELSTRDDTDATTETYFEWPESGTGERLERLLALHEIPAGSFADLRGSDLLLRAENDHWIPVVPDERPRGDDRAVYGIVAGLTPSVAIALFSFFGFGGAVGSSLFLALWLVCTFVVLPVSVYLDAWHLRTSTDWRGGPLRWAFLSALPAFSVVVVPFYLIMRENARPLA